MEYIIYINKYILHFINIQKKEDFYAREKDL